MTKDQVVILKVPVEVARLLYTFLEYAPAIEVFLVSNHAIKKLSPKYKQMLVNLYDDLGFKLSMELFD